MVWFGFEGRVATLETDLPESPGKPFLNVIKLHTWNQFYAQQYENEIKGQEKQYLERIFQKYYLER